jgi:hypothetical protein
VATTFSFESVPKICEKFAIQAYKRPKNTIDLLKTHVPYSGPPQPHAYESDQVILRANPFCTHTFHYEFKTENISFLEGKTISMGRLWVEKGSIGLQCSTFIVEQSAGK